MKTDYFYENYRLVDFYDDMYSYTEDYKFWFELCKNANSILEIASGTGRLTIPLSSHCEKVYALDYSPEMVDILNNKIKENNIKNITVFTEDMRNFKFNRKFDLIIIPSNSLNHIETNEDLEKTFKNIYDHLNDGGIFSFDILNPYFEFLLRNKESFYGEKIYKQKKTGKYFKFYENNCYNKALQINNVSYYFQYCNKVGDTIEDKTYKMNMKVRLYFPKEMDYYLEKNNFEIVNKFDWYDQSPFLGNSGEQIYVIRKKTK